MLTFRPNLYQKFGLICAWLESELRSDWINLTQPKAVREETATLLQSQTHQLLKRVSQLWEEFLGPEDTYFKTLYPEALITSTSVITPSLLKMNYRLTLEERHYVKLLARQQARASIASTRQMRRSIQLMPSWDHRNHSNHRRRHLYQSYREIERRDQYIPSIIWRGIAFVVILSFVDVAAYVILANYAAILNEIARLLAGSGLEFWQAYGAFGLVAISLISVPIYLALELFHQPTMDDLQESILDLDSHLEERNLELANILEAEILPRLSEPIQDQIKD